MLHTVRRMYVVLPTFRQTGQLYLRSLKRASSTYFPSKGVVLPTFRRKSQFYLLSVKMADSTYILSKKFYLLSVKSASFTYFPSKGLSTGFHLFLYTPNFYSQFPKRAINHGQKVHKSYTSIYRILNFAVHLIGFKPETKSKLR